MENNDELPESWQGLLLEALADGPFRADCMTCGWSGCARVTAFVATRDRCEHERETGHMALVVLHRDDEPPARRDSYIGGLGGGDSSGGRLR